MEPTSSCAPDSTTKLVTRARMRIANACLAVVPSCPTCACARRCRACRPTPSWSEASGPLVEPIHPDPMQNTVLQAKCPIRVLMCFRSWMCGELFSFGAKTSNGAQHRQQTNLWPCPMPVKSCNMQHAVSSTAVALSHSGATADVAATVVSDPRRGAVGNELGRCHMKGRAVK